MKKKSLKSSGERKIGALFTFDNKKVVTYILYRQRATHYWPSVGQYMNFFLILIIFFPKTYTGGVEGAGDLARQIPKMSY